MRKIIHIDMDCFYAAVEMRERPELAGLPIAVGGGSPRGVVTTCNYEARAYGVRSAMPGFKARELCPHITFLPVRFDLYRAESRIIREIFNSYTDLVEPLSLDEAFLDVTALDRYAWDIAREIRTRIFETTRLTASAGVAANKMLAKIASDWRKPNGQFAIQPKDVADFMKTLPLRRVWGVGPKAAERFAALSLHTCGDIQQFSKVEMSTRWGVWGRELYDLCRGEDDRPVQPNRIRKSLSNERTYSENLQSLAACRTALAELILELQEELRSKAADRPIRKLFVKVKFADFSRTTKECVYSQPDADAYYRLLTDAHQRSEKAVRLLGVGVRFGDIAQEEEILQIPLPLG